MLFFGLFLHESARTAAKSQTNLSTNSGKATKRLGRLAPNLAHMCKFIWEWIYAKTNCPSRHKGGSLGVLGQARATFFGRGPHQYFYRMSEATRPESFTRMIIKCYSMNS